MEIIDIPKHPPNLSKKSLNHPFSESVEINQLKPNPNISSLSVRKSSRNKIQSNAVKSKSKSIARELILDKTKQHENSSEKVRESITNLNDTEILVTKSNSSIDVKTEETSSSTADSATAIIESNSSITTIMTESESSTEMISPTTTLRDSTNSETTITESSDPGILVTESSKPGKSKRSILTHS